jgi:glycosyltransferase involved in cell wall biosynthesis
MSLSLIIFCYNEESTIKKVILDSLEFLKTNSFKKYEIILVNDGSTDQTQTRICELKNVNDNLKIINHKENLGIGMALNTGYKHSIHQFIVAIPGDGQFDINDLKQINNWDENKFYCFFRKNRNYGFYRTFLSEFNILINSIFLKNNIKDVNWVKVYSKNQLLNVKPQLNSSLIESEITSKLIKKGYVYEEFPSSYLPRMGGVPKGGSFKTVIKAFLEMIKLIYLVRKH